jgi:hypothetical protein
MEEQRRNAQLVRSLAPEPTHASRDRMRRQGLFWRGLQNGETTDGYSHTDRRAYAAAPMSVRCATIHSRQAIVELSMGSLLRLLAIILAGACQARVWLSRSMAAPHCTLDILSTCAAARVRFGLNAAASTVAEEQTNTAELCLPGEYREPGSANSGYACSACRPQIGCDRTSSLCVADDGRLSPSTCPDQSARRELLRCDHLGATVSTRGKYLSSTFGVICECAEQLHCLAHTVDCADQLPVDGDVTYKRCAEDGAQGGFYVSGGRVRRCRAVQNATVACEDDQTSEVTCHPGFFKESGEAGALDTCTRMSYRACLSAELCPPVCVS